MVFGIFFLGDMFFFWCFSKPFLETFRGLSFPSEEDPYDFENGFDSAGPDFWSMVNRSPGRVKIDAVKDLRNSLGMIYLPFSTVGICYVCSLEG